MPAQSSIESHSAPHEPPTHEYDGHEADESIQPAEPDIVFVPLHKEHH